MKKTHKISSISLLQIFTFSFVALFLSCSSEETYLVVFVEPENWSVAYGTTKKVEIVPIETGIEVIYLKIQDSIVAKWSNPVKNKGFSYLIQTEQWGIGAKKIELIAVKKQQEYAHEKRLIILSDIQPKGIAYEIINSYPHSITHFTQGFEFDGDQLFEGTGQLGESKLAKIQLENGESIQEVALSNAYFGEGITIVGDTVYQLTWTSNKCFLYDKNTLKPLPEVFSYSGEGWGICNNGKELFTSNGSHQLVVRNPKTFEPIRTLEVYTDQQAVVRLNELEFIDGFIYANIWMTNNIAIIEPEKGRVVGLVNATELVSKGRGQVGDSFNGIAYNKKRKTIFVTGKNWEKTFEIKLIDFDQKDILGI